MIGGGEHMQPRTRSRNSQIAWRLGVVAVEIVALVFAGCGQKRRFGDEDGVPTAFSVTLERGFVADMRNRQGRVGVGGGVGFGSGGSVVGTGVGVSFSPTAVYLVGGDQPGGAQVFRKELSWGENAFTVPLRAGRELHLTVQAQGGREGWESVGVVTIPADPGAVVRLNLASDGPHASVVAAPAATQAAGSAR